MAVVDELVQHSGESGIQVANNVTLGTVPVVETDVMSLLANLEKVQEEAAISRAKLDKLCAVAEPVAEEHHAMLIEVRGER